jgi:hypothetical protein
MKFFFILSTFALTSALAQTDAGVPASTATQAQPIAVAPAPTVRPTTLLVSAIDIKGNPVSVPTKESVTVMDSGRTAQLLDVRRADSLPVKLVIMLLGRHSTFSQQKNAAIDLVQKALRPGTDQVLIMTANGTKQWTKPLQWESDPAKAVDFLKSLDGKEGLTDAFDFSMDTDMGNESRVTLRKSDMSDKSVFEIAWGMLMQDPKPARRVLVTFRNPVAHAGGAGTRQIREYTDNRHAGIIAVAQAIRLPIYTIAVEDPELPGTSDIKANYSGNFGGSGSSLRNYDESLSRAKHQAALAGRSSIQRLSDETGGLFSASTKKNFADAVDAIAAGIKSQYAVTFVPAEAGANPRVPVDVFSNGVKLSAPKSYPRQ